MKRALGTVAISVVTALALSAAPAGAAQVTVPDPQGDSPEAPLDLLGFTASNNDLHLRIELTVEDATRDGDLFVNVKPRQGDGVRIVSRFRPAGKSRTFLLDQAVTDDGAGKNTRLRCPGLKLRQGFAGSLPTIIFDLPSRCLSKGNYGALRLIAVVEADRDAQVKPEANDEIAKSDYVARG
ncbi:hypothetical protein [Nocardioides sp. SR21]|uniref:hypothetical protein n=1 Tax=Nocardioides sp. SR21 TaxID=2919501 RepID=UPI001FA9AD3E|nr:hypothetical protein [Nocardioides sp. SR21]